MAATGVLLLQAANTVNYWTQNDFFLILSAVTALAAVGLLLLAAVGVSALLAARLSLLGAAAAILLTGAAYLDFTPGTYQTDLLALSHESAHLLLNGENPYEHYGDEAQMRDIFQRRLGFAGLPFGAISERRDGTLEDRVWSYPAGPIYLYSLPLSLGLEDVRWVTIGAVLAALGLLWAFAPMGLKPLAAVPVIVDQNLAVTQAIVIGTDWLWVVPTLGVVWAISRNHFGKAALLYGLALGMKQQPLILAPFLLVLLWQRFPFQDRTTRIKFLLKPALIAVAVFLLVNLPFIVWDPGAWLSGVTYLARAEQVFGGVGLSFLTSKGIMDISQTTYTVMSLLALAISLLVFARNPSKLQHAMWLLPFFFFWFSYRSLNHYLIFWPVLMVASLLLAASREEREAAPATEALHTPPLGEGESRTAQAVT